jgi:aurora kinase, other
VYGKELGRGKFGQVYLAKHIETGFIVAIKRVLKETIKRYNMVDRFVEEIKLHSRLNHPNIVKFYGFFEEEDSICLVLEYLSGGTLFDYLNELGCLPLKDALSFLREIIGALDYLHQQSIIHRDLKPENIVISSAGVAKICDFGWSAVV